MTSGKLSKRVIVDRLAWIERMVKEICALPLDDRASFLNDSRNVWTAESCLRRTLEALFDLGRHILAKGFGVGASEYKEIAQQLAANEVMSQDNAKLLVIFAGYRNRLVHFYHEVSPDELLEICRTGIMDIEQVTQAYRSWIKSHHHLLDEAL